MPLPPRWRVHSPRTDAVDPDPVSHEVTGQGLGHANHGGLGGAVGEAGGQAAHRGAHRGHVDDGAAAVSLHLVKMGIN